MLLPNHHRRRILHYWRIAKNLSYHVSKRSKRFQRSDDALTYHRRPALCCQPMLLTRSPSRPLGRAWWRQGGTHRDMKCGRSNFWVTLIRSQRPRISSETYRGECLTKYMRRIITVIRLLLIKCTIIIAARLVKLFISIIAALLAKLYISTSRIGVLHRPHRGYPSNNNVDRKSQNRETPDNTKWTKICLPFSFVLTLFFSYIELISLS